MLDPLVGRSFCCDEVEVFSLCGGCGKVPEEIGDILSQVRLPARKELLESSHILGQETGVVKTGALTDLK